MKYLSYRQYQKKSQLFVENVAISDVAKVVGTPFYCYSKNALIDNYQEFISAMDFHKIHDYKICYAIKANYNFHIVSLLSSLKAGIDAVSSGEIYRAIKAGIDPQKIVFAGVGKTREDIEFALNNGVLEFSVESIDEMFLLNEVATKLNKSANFLCELILMLMQKLTIKFLLVARVINSELILIWQKRSIHWLRSFLP